MLTKKNIYSGLLFSSSQYPSPTHSAHSSMGSVVVKKKLVRQGSHLRPLWVVMFLLLLNQTGFISSFSSIPTCLRLSISQAKL